MTHGSGVGPAPGRREGTPPRPQWPPTSPPQESAAGLDLVALSRMLAEGWTRLGLATRIEDRADGIYRVLRSAHGDAGLTAAAEELRRIPQEAAFFGSLEVLNLVDLFRTILDRKLRGKLEISTCDGGQVAHVLYLDCGTLDEIIALAGDGDLVLLPILRELGALDEPTYQALSSARGGGSLVEPLEMQLRRGALVDEEQLRRARELRARHLFLRICEARHGAFAFIELRQGAGRGWPTEGLGLQVEELLREQPQDLGDSAATSTSRLMSDTARVAAVARAVLTERERELLDFFSRGATLHHAREHFGDGEEVAQVVNRLEGAGLLRRSRDERPRAPLGVERPRTGAMLEPTVSVSLVPQDLDPVHEVQTERTVITDLHAAWRSQRDDETPSARRLESSLAPDSAAVLTGEEVTGAGSQEGSPQPDARDSRSMENRVALFDDEAVLQLAADVSEEIEELLGAMLDGDDNDGF